jgi:VWFA-related protein
MTGGDSFGFRAWRAALSRWRGVALTVATVLVACGACPLPAQQSPAPQQSAQTPQNPQTQQGAPAVQASQGDVPQASGKVTAETNLVTLYATVRDRHGKIVPTLNKEDFTLSEDGHPQTISYFARETDLPLTLGLLVDTSQSQMTVLDEERDASFTFLDHMMREDKDTAFVMHFDREAELLQDVTGSKPKLQAALKLIAPSPPDDDSQSGGQGSQGRGSRGAGTLLYDAVYLASREVIANQKGRKAIFVLTDGVDRGSKETLEEAIEAAQRADAVVYGIYYSGSEPSGFSHGYGHGGGMGRGGGGGWPGGGGGGGRGGHSPQGERVDGKKVLEKLSTETGGRMFEISKKLPIDQAYAAIEEELRNQYSLGYMPPPGNGGAGYHRIKLVVNQKDDSAQARDGYYSDH